MNPIFSVSLIIALACVAFAALGVFLWERWQEKRKQINPSQETALGAVRGYFALLWVLIFWGSFLFLLPLLVTYKDTLQASLGSKERFYLLAKALFLPSVLLATLLYSYRKKYYRWIKDPNWPGKYR